MAGKDCIVCQERPGDFLNSMTGPPHDVQYVCFACLPIWVQAIYDMAGLKLTFELDETEPAAADETPANGQVESVERHPSRRRKSGPPAVETETAEAANVAE